MKSLPSGWKYSIGLIVSILLLFAANLWVGSVRIPAGAVWDILCGHAVERESWRFILLESRIPQGITALLCGAALAVSGLMLQTVCSVEEVLLPGFSVYPVFWRYWPELLPGL